MNKLVNVLVTWTNSKLYNLPASLKYITVAKFKEDINWEKNAWSIVLDFTIPPETQKNPSKAIAYFLVDNSPQERLIKGSTFELFEGKIKVADVTIL